jgi:hypothetical protein
MPVDAGTLQAWGDYLVQNQQNADSDEYKTIARAFQKADGELQQNLAQNREYAGLGGVVKAGAQMIPRGAAGVVGSVLDVAAPMSGTMSQLDRMVANGTGKPDSGGYFQNKAQEVSDALGFKKVEDLPEIARPAGYAGEFIGGGLPVAVATGGASIAANGVRASLPLIAGEAGALAGGAGGTYLAEKIAPDSTAARVAGGLIGSFVSPTALATAAATRVGKIPGVGGAGTFIADAISPTRGAARNFGDAIEKGGGDVGAVLQQIRDNPGLAPTLASDNQTIHDAVAHFAASDPQFARAQKAMQDAQAAGLINARAGQNIGGTTADDFASALRRNADATDQMATQREGLARQAAASFTPDYSTVRNANRGLVDDLTTARKASKTKVDAAYQSIPNAPLPNLGTNLAQKMQDLQSQGWTFDAIAPDTSALIRRVTAQGYTPTIKDAVALSGQLGRDARSIRGGSAMDNRAIATAFKLRDEVTSHLRNVSGWDKANSLSRAHQDTFRDATGPDVLLEMAYGQNRTKLDPQLAGDTILSGTPNAQTLKLDNLGKATGNPQGIVDRLDPTVRQQLGLNAMSDGMISPDKANTLLNRRDDITSFFPKAQQDLRAAAAQSQVAQDARAGATAAAKQADTLAPGLQAQPENVIGSIIRSQKNNPFDDLTSLYKTAKAQGAEDGLKAALREYVTKAGDPLQAAVRMTEPIAGDKSLLDWMKGSGLLNTTEHATLSKTADMLIKSHVAGEMASAKAFNPNGVIPDPLDILARVAGAKVAAKFAKGGASIQIASIGSETARKLLRGMVGSRQGDVLKDALAGSNQRGLEDLLTRYQSMKGQTVPGQPSSPQMPIWMKPSSYLANASTNTNPDNAKAKPKQPVPRVVPGMRNY